MRDKWITDHRVKMTLNGVLDDYLQGGESMERFMDAVEEVRLRQFVKEQSAGSAVE